MRPSGCNSREDFIQRANKQASKQTNNRNSNYRHNPHLLRTVPTKYTGFCARLGPREKVYLIKGYWNPQRKMWETTHSFEIISLEPQPKC